ncbi:MAG: class I SAM-dependent methyltransferase [Spirochaetaceae bacterium]|jgi:O-methyltransferase|nr:class I SAM-dependent methyltransferase [Spirochaetaceae bacterium]
MNHQVEEAKKILESHGWGLIPPENYLIDIEEDFLKLWDSISGFTMISVERAYSIYQSILYLINNKIHGDFVECGVWRGGASMLAAMIYQKKIKDLPELWLYDTFSGMTEPGEEDIIAVSGEAVSKRSPQGWWAVSMEEVQQNLLSTGYPKDKLHFIKGDVSDTLKSSKPKEISLLRLDTDWYESTRQEMEILYPLLNTKGILLLDDYGHFKGARKAVDQYFKGQNLLLQRVDYTGRLLIKD